jgi:hypothetical protein
MMYARVAWRRACGRRGHEGALTPRGYTAPLSPDGRAGIVPPPDAPLERVGERPAVTAQTLHVALAMPEDEAERRVGEWR